MVTFRILVRPATGSSVANRTDCDDRPPVCGRPNCRRQRQVILISTKCHIRHNRVLNCSAKKTGSDLLTVLVAVGSALRHTQGHRKKHPGDSAIDFGCANTHKFAGYVRDSSQSASAKIQAANFHGHSSSPEDVDSAIAMAAARHNVDPNLVRAVVKVESNYNPNAVSRKGAMGLMQLMPSTARQLNVKNPFDPQQNVDAGVRHLKQLLENYGGDVNLTLAAYNAGSGAVARSAGIPHYSETQNYVRRITNLYYGGFDVSTSGASHDPVKVQRDARGVLYISNTD